MVIVEPKTSIKRVAFISVKSGMCPTWRERCVGNGLMVIVEPKTRGGLHLSEVWDVPDVA